MAINATATWRVRAGGSDLNGAGYDSAISGADSTTLNGSATAIATSITVTSATGFPASGNYYVRIGNVGAETVAGSSEIVLVTGGQGTTTWTVTRAQLGTTAIAFASGVVVDTNVSQGNTAAFSGSDGTSNNSVTFTSATGAFNETVVGNCLRLASGTNGTVGYYFVTGYTDATTITLDRACSTAAMTNGAWKIGGAAANWTAALFAVGSATGNKIVPGNKVYIRGAGTNSPTANDYTMTTWVTPVLGNVAVGRVFFMGEYGRPRTTVNGMLLFSIGYVEIADMVIETTGTNGGGSTILCSGAGTNCIRRCKFEMTNVAQPAITTGSAGLTVVESCEIDGEGTSASANGIGVSCGAFGAHIIGCVIKNCRGVAVKASVTNSGIRVENSIIAGNWSDGIEIAGNAGYQQNIITGSVIDNNEGHGINILTTAATMETVIKNNIISNHDVAAKVGLRIAAGAASLNDLVIALANYNAFFNNTSHYSGVSAGANDVTLTASPYVSSSDWTLNNTAGGGAACRDAGFPQVMPGLASTDVYTPIGLLGTPAAGGGGLVAPVVSASGNILVRPA